MNVVSLFSGVGGFDLGLERAGFTVTAQVENDGFCQRVLAARWPGVERTDDVRGVRSGMVGSASNNAPSRGREPTVSTQHIDLLVGGFPCQDLSVAGKRAGLGGARSSLFYEFVRIAKALRPPLLLVENVPGLLSSDGGADVGIVLDSLHEAGYLTEVEECDSQHYGVPQRRRRLFFIGVDAISGLQRRTHFSSATLAAVIAGSLLEAWELLDRPSATESVGLDGMEPSRADIGLLRKMQSYAAGSDESPWPTLLEVLTERLLASECEPLTWACPSETPDGDNLPKAIGPGSPSIAVDTSTVKSWRQLWGDLWRAPSVSTISTWSKATTAEKICTCAEATLTISRLTGAWSGSCPHCWTVASLCLTGLLACIASLNRIADDLFVPPDWRDHARVLLAETETRACDLVGGPTEAGVVQVLALWEGGGGDSAARGEAGTDITPRFAHGAEHSERLVIAFDPTTSLDQAPNDRTSPPCKVGTGIASMPWAPAIAVFDTYNQSADIQAHTLRVSTDHGIQSTPHVWRENAIRRLTPLECERLQGFPDGWTCLCQPLMAYQADPDAAALACRCPDSPRYRAMGNAVTVNVIEWLGRRLMDAAAGGA
jgi:site-specific DNA-cytosine methylase